ncbi:hypothetical protein ElyMa_002397000 [Elysia marginata]|uniref:Uncharacterized protein n=1 Tax=Elysia marginata TaxID=1093978 RepID=A0AAV4GGX2_9GAST|nr:hypothetical protein ElyMa_002397000 [Elysia marginata]
MVNLKKCLGPLLALGYAVVVVFQVYLFYHFLEVALHGYWWTRTYCTPPQPTTPTNSPVSFLQMMPPPQTSPPSSIVEPDGPSPRLSSSSSSLSSDKELQASGSSGHFRSPSGSTKTAEAEDDVLARKDAAKDSRANNSNPSSGRRTRSRVLRSNDCQKQYGYIFPRMALCCQFVATYSTGLTTYFAWMIGVRRHGQFVYHHSLAALLTTILGLFSTAFWASGMVNDRLDHHWQFWPYVLSYIYVMVAVLPFLAINQDSSGFASTGTHRGPPRMTETEWLRWHRIRERTRQIDELVEAAGGGNVLYNQNPDGSYSLCRWRADSQGEVTNVKLPIEADVGAEGAAGTAGLDQASHSDQTSHLATLSPTATTGSEVRDSDILLVIPENEPPSRTAARNSPRTSFKKKKAQDEMPSGSIGLRPLSPSNPEPRANPPASAPTPPTGDTAASSVGASGPAIGGNDLGRPEEEDDRDEDESAPLLSADAKKASYGGS